MNEIRIAYLDSYRALRPLAASSELRERWDDESTLKDFSVRGLAGHLIVRTGWAVLDYLETDVAPGTQPIEAEAYYATVLGRMGPNEHQEVRVRGEAAAPDGPEALLAAYDDAVRYLGRLDSYHPKRLVEVFGGLVMKIDDYLKTRICEILIHADDLAASLGLEPPRFPKHAWDIAFDHLLAVARLTHGDRAVLMGFSRRERDTVEALRIF